MGKSRDNGVRATLITVEITNIGSEVEYKIESKIGECKLFMFFLLFFKMKCKWFCTFDL